MQLLATKKLVLYSNGSVERPMDPKQDARITTTLHSEMNGFCNTVYKDIYFHYIRNF